MATSTQMDGFESFIVRNSPEQRVIEGEEMPFILSPPSSSNSCSLRNVQDCVEWVDRYRSEINTQLEERGVVLFRNFPLHNGVEDYNRFIKNGFPEYTDLSYERSMSFAVRNKVTDRICTTNEGKNGGLVFHHEQAQTPFWPKYIFFICELPAAEGDGGETGIVRSDVIYEKLKQKYPDFIHKCETIGIKYTVYAGPEQDTSKGAGRSWKSFFHVDTKEQCEQKMIQGGWEYQWGVDCENHPISTDFLRATTPKLDAVKLAPNNTTKKCFFNQLIATTANALEFSKVGNNASYNPLVDIPTQEGIDSCVKFADGTTIPLEILLDAKQICEDYSINISWQKNDIALISNYLCMHARRIWNGPDGSRKLLASLVEETNCTSFGKPLVVP